MVIFLVEPGPAVVDHRLEFILGNSCLLHISVSLLERVVSPPSRLALEEIQQGGPQTLVSEAVHDEFVINRALLELHNNVVEAGHAVC